jgi:hypothetical protein
VTIDLFDPRTDLLVHSVVQEDHAGLGRAGVQQVGEVLTNALGRVVTVDQGEVNRDMIIAQLPEQLR